jgi:serine/threonine protein kinase
MRPNIPCKDLKKSMNTKMNDIHVSKLFLRQNDADDESNDHNKYIPLIDPNGIFTLKIIEKCQAAHKELDPGEVGRCMNFAGHNLDVRPSLPQIIYEYGGLDLSKACRHFPFEELFLAMWRTFEGLTLMEMHKVSHLDIKPLNMVYNPDTKKLALIDFGQIIPFKDMHTKTFCFEATYDYFPPEFVAISDFMEGGIISPNQHNNWDVFFERCVEPIKTRIVAKYGKHAPLARAWASLIRPLPMNVLMSQSQRMFSTDKPIKDVISSVAQKVDVHMLGISLFEILCLCERFGTLDISKNPEFYTKVLKLIARMIDMSVDTRFTPQQAYGEYKRVAKMVMVVPPPPSLISPIHVKPPPTSPKPSKPSKPSKQAKPAKPVKPFEPLKPCPEGKVRNPVTRRCNAIVQAKKPKKVESSTQLNPKPAKPTKPVKPFESLKPCPEGKVRNPVTRRCNAIVQAIKPKKVASSAQLNEKPVKQVKPLESLKPCPEGKVRHPVTRRCRNIPKSV